ncbi:MAG TPA: glucose 1-dehydrogenase [Polyangia bacterium]|nr:glucose 1-dehydrogenase [Polyangia bacterium]
MFDLKGKAAIITGGGSGIGQAVSMLFARQGARVAILDLQAEPARETAAQIGAAGGVALALPCDVADAAAVKAAFAAAEDAHGPVNILVNNAGIAQVGTLETTSEVDFDRVCRVNIKGAYLCAQAAVARMLPRGGGVILNMASIAALIGIPERFAYSVTKGAILTMTYSIAIDYMKKGIRCNCICPARIHTPFVDGFVAKSYPGHEAEMLAKLHQYQPVGRMGRPEEVAALALYLCSDEASFVTGAAYPIDGGVLVT